MPEDSCSVEGCDDPVRYGKLRLCGKCYQRRRKYGTTAGRICAVQECNAQVNALGWCVKHYQLWRAHGTVADPICMAARCESRAHAHGLCPMHLDRQKRLGSIREEVQKGGLRYQKPAVCAIEECGAPCFALDWCQNHYQANYRHGDPLVKLRSFVRQGPECSFEGCDRQPQAHGLCPRHANAADRIAHPERYQRYEAVRRARVQLLPDDLTAAQWSRILDECGNRCAWSCPCARGRKGCVDSTLSLEHLIPISRGIVDGIGGTTAANCLPACKSCNSKKHDSTPAEWAARGGYLLRYQATLL